MTKAAKKTKPTKTAKAAKKSATEPGRVKWVVVRRSNKGLSSADQKTYEHIWLVETRPIVKGFFGQVGVVRKTTSPSVLRDYLEQGLAEHSIASLVSKLSSVQGFPDKALAQRVCDAFNDLFNTASPSA